MLTISNRMLPVILDGPIGTELERLGVPMPGPGWSAHALVAAENDVARVHRAYAAAGATVHTANTFRTRLRSIGPNWEALARRAVALARQSARGGRVAGSIGPLEDCYRPELSPGIGARAEHAELARVLVDAGVDLILCEAFAAGEEARVAVEEAVRTEAETWVALTAGPEGTLMSPDRMLEAARACVGEGASVVLVNCVGASRIGPFVSAVAELGAPFGVYANAGDRAEGIGWGAPGDLGVRAYADFARGWVDVGASVVGGCCGTGPRHIAELSRTLRSRAS